MIIEYAIFIRIRIIIIRYRTKRIKHIKKYNSDKKQL